MRIRHFHPVLQADGFGRYVVVQESDRIGFGPSEERGMASPTRDRSGRFARPNHQENAKRRPHSIHLGWYSTTARMVSGGVGWCRVLGQTEVRARLTPEVRARLIRPHAQAVVAQAVGRFTNESFYNMCVRARKFNNLHRLLFTHMARHTYGVPILVLDFHLMNASLI